MTLEDLKRVCDDAERWNAKFAGSDSSGWEALKAVREGIKPNESWRVWYGEVIVQEKKE